MDNNSIYTACCGDLDLRGYEVVRVQFFSFFAAKSVTFSIKGIRFSVECIRNLGSIEYVKLLVHPERKSLIVKPCEQTDRQAIKWAVAKDGKGYSRTISGAAFIKTLFELFDWLPEYRYRFRGSIKNLPDEISIEFDLHESETITKERIVHPDDWYTGFGVDYYRYINSKRITGADISAETHHLFNLEPGIRPTAPRTLDSSINSIIDAIINSEAENGAKSNTGDSSR